MGKYTGDCKSLHRLLGECINSVKGKAIGKGDTWQVDVQALAIKYFVILGTVLQLLNGTTLTHYNDHNYLSYSSIAVLTRSLYETYIVFHFIYAHSQGVSENKFRHAIWKIGGLSSRQKFYVTKKENMEKLASEKESIDKLRQFIENNSHYATLDEKRKKEALKGKWRLGKSWTDLAKEAGLSETFNKPLYSFLSDYAHSGYISAMQLYQMNQENRCNSSDTCISICSKITAFFIKNFCSNFNEAATCLVQIPESKALLDRWHITAEIWEKHSRWTQPYEKKFP